MGRILERERTRILERERTVSEAEEGSVEPAETYCSTNLPHVLLRDGVGTEHNR